jgi:hypothetical protein
MNQTLKSVILRFVRGCVAGAVSTMLTITLSAPSTWREMYAILSSLALAGTIGAITGGLMALDKYLRSE